MGTRDTHILLDDSESFHPNRQTPTRRSTNDSPMNESPTPSPAHFRTFESESSDCSLSQLAAADRSQSQLQASRSRAVCAIEPHAQPNPPESLQQPQRARASTRSRSRFELAQRPDRERDHSKSYPVGKRVYAVPQPLLEESPSSEEHYCQCSAHANPLVSPSKSHSGFGGAANFRMASAAGTRSFNEDFSRTTGWTQAPTRMPMPAPGGGLESRSYTLPPPTRRSGALTRSHSGIKAHVRSSASTAHRSLPREQHAAARTSRAPSPSTTQRPSGRSRARASEAAGADATDSCAGGGDREDAELEESCALDSTLPTPPPPPDARAAAAVQCSASRRSLSNLEARRVYQPVVRAMSIDLSPAGNDSCERRALPHTRAHPCCLAQRCTALFHVHVASHMHSPHNY